MCGASSASGFTWYITVKHFKELTALCKQEAPEAQLRCERVQRNPRIIRKDASWPQKSR